MPGSPIDPRAEWTNGLLKQGATLVTEVADVLAVIEPILGQRSLSAMREPDGAGELGLAEPDNDARTRLLSLLGPTPVGIDDLVRLANASPAIVRTILLELELAGRVERSAGGLVALA